MHRFQHTNHNDEYIYDDEPLTKHEWNILAIGVSILIFLFFVIIGLIINWEPLISTAGMFTLFWSYHFAISLSKGIVFTNITAKGIGKALLYVACIIIICVSIMYEILVLFGQ